MREMARLESELSRLETLSDDAQAYLDLLELATAEGQEDIQQEAERSLLALDDQLQTLRIEALFSETVDSKDCYLDINAGAGGTEAQDWAQMLARMYLRWAEKHQYRSESIAYVPGEEAGLKSATFHIQGRNVFGWLKTESGIHRLVRLSPFNSLGKRHTSFAAISVTPALDESISVDINPRDLRIDTYRASGAGGQHVNRTDSAVRITHLPSNIVVQCQQERSQHQNKARALHILKGRLYQREQLKQEQQKASLEALKSDIGWGQHIRSYVLHPYQMVKDLRTLIESPRPSDVLDGEIDPFLQAALARLATQSSS